MAKLSARKQESPTPRSNILRKFRMAPLIAAALLIFVAFEIYSTGLFPLSTKGKQELIREPYGQDDAAFDYNAQQQNDTDSLDSGTSPKSLSSATPDFTPGYLPTGFIQEGSSVSGSPGGKETEETVSYTYRNPQTGASINLQITSVASEETTASEQRAAAAADVSFFAEKEGRHYLIRISGDVSSEELKKVANSLK